MAWTPASPTSQTTSPESSDGPSEARRVPRGERLADPPLLTRAAATARAPRSRSLGSPRLSIVLVNYRQWEETHELVRQLQATAAVKHGDVEIVIVDNHSPAHPLSRKLRRMNGVSLRRWERNFGFARAVNEGCRLALGDWLLLLNPDMTIPENFVGDLLALTDTLPDAEPDAGIIGFHLRNSDGSQQLSTGSFPTLVSTVSRLLLPRHRRKYQAPRALARTPVAWVTGCCLLVRRDCLVDVGGLDEEFFLYYEDVDLCLRARERGWSVAYEPNLAVVHHHPLHGRSVPAAMRLVTRHSLLIYAGKHWRRWQFRLLAGIIGLETRVRRLKAWWRGDPQEAALYRTLSAMAAALVQGDRKTARRHLDRAMRHIDVRVGV